MIKFLDLYSQYQGLKDEIDAAMADVIRKSAFIGGEYVERFELAFAAYQTVEHCVAVGNGTDAIEIALEALDLPKGCEVIVPANSFIASSEAVTRSGYQVVFADVDPVSYTLDVTDVERRITSRTKAIVAVHLYGNPCDMDGLLALAAKHQLRIVEDCAQAHGAEYKGRRVGGLGDVGTFSFYPGKNLGAYGDGGAITTNDSALAKQCRMIANHGRLEKYNHLFEGRSSRLDGLQAAILLVKLAHLDRWIAARNEVARLYAEGLARVPDLIVPSARPGCRHAYHLFVVRTPNRDALAECLRAARIQTGVHYPVALPCLPAYAHLSSRPQLKFAIGAAAQLLSLPIGEHLSEAEIQEVVQTVRGFHRTALATAIN